MISPRAAMLRGRCNLRRHRPQRMLPVVFSRLFVTANCVASQGRKATQTVGSDSASGNSICCRRRRRRRAAKESSVIPSRSSLNAERAAPITLPCPFSHRPLLLLHHRVTVHFMCPSSPPSRSSLASHSITAWRMFSRSLALKISR